MTPEVGRIIQWEPTPKIDKQRAKASGQHQQGVAEEVTYTQIYKDLAAVMRGVNEDLRRIATGLGGL